MMKKLFPSLPMSIVLLLLWLLLNGSVSPGHIALGALLGWFGPIAAGPLRPLKARPRLTRGLPVLIVHVVTDVIRSNFAVAAIVLGFNRRKWVSGFIRIPLNMTDPHGLAVLSGIVTVTPGTVWAGRDPHTNVLTLHVLDLRSESEWVVFIKTRYEQPLMEIYE